MPMPNPRLKVEITQQGDTVIIKLIGEARLDVEDAQFQLDRVVVFHPKFIILDAGQLTFLSSIGMSLLLNLRRTAAKSGGRVKLVALQPFVRDAMAHASLLEMFDLYPDMPAALATLQPAQPAS